MSVLMKDSGVEWIGDIPEGWDIKKLKYLGKSIIGLTYSPKDVSNEEEGILVLRSANIQNGKMDFNNTVFVNMEIPQNLITQKNDILICSRNGSRKLIGKNILIDETNKNVTFGAFMTIFRSEINKYLYFVFNSTIFSQQAGSFMTSTINQLTINAINNMKVAIPPKTEQQKIANFLDEATSKIDNVIQAKQTQLKKLEELKKSIIHKAVTKGLDDSVDMKDSGIEWIGDIPKHWKKERLKDIVYINIDSLSTDTNLEYKIKYIEISNVNNQGIISKDEIRELSFEEAPSRAKRKIQKGDTIVSSVRPNLQALAYIESKEDNLICSTGFFTNRIIWSEKHSDKYIYYFLLSEFSRQSFISYGKGVGYPAVDDKDYSTLKIIYPPKTEQQKIVSYLDQEVEKINSLKQNVSKQIEKLKEYKKSLIYEYVTGKKQVKE